MGRFLRENWLWIAAPMLIVLGLLFWFLGSQDSSAVGGFDYPID